MQPIKTERLILRPLSVEDKPAIFYNIANDEEVLKYYIMNYEDDIDDFSLDVILDYYVRTGKFCFAIELQDNKTVIGMIHECATRFEDPNEVEIGYAIGKKYWNKGYTTEALKAFIDFLFSQGRSKIDASFITENVASGRVMEKCQMTFENAIEKNSLYYRGQYFDTRNCFIVNEGLEND